MQLAVNFGKTQQVEPEENSDDVGQEKGIELPEVDNNGNEIPTADDIIPVEDDDESEMNA